MYILWKWLLQKDWLTPPSTDIITFCLCVVRRFKITLSIFHVYNRVLLTIVTMLSIRTYHITQVCTFDQHLFISPTPGPLAITFLHSFYEFSFLDSICYKNKQICLCMIYFTWLMPSKSNCIVTKGRISFFLVINAYIQFFKSTLC